MFSKHRCTNQLIRDRTEVSFQQRDVNFVFGRIAVLREIKESRQRGIDIAFVPLCIQKTKSQGEARECEPKISAIYQTLVILEHSNANTDLITPNSNKH